MDGIGAGFPGGIENAIDAQVAFAGWRRSDRHRLIGIQNMQGGAVGVGVHGHGRITELAAGTNDANCDLAAVRDQDLHSLRVYPDAGR